MQANDGVEVVVRRRLRQLRLQRGLTLEDVAHQARIDVLLKLSNDIAENAGDVDDSDVQAAREAGVTDEEIGELVANLALNTLTNYFNVLAHVDNDWPVVSL